MPRITQEHKQRNRAKIVASAGERFRVHGIGGVGIDELMKAAGLTHGGFYNHFASKDALALEVLHQGFTDSLAALAAIRAAHPGDARSALHELVDVYLDADQRDHPEAGCASATLAADAGRYGPDTQAEYQRGLDGYLGSITELLLEEAHQSDTELDPATARAHAVALFSQLVGAMVIARAVTDTTPSSSDEILTTNRHQAKTTWIDRPTP